MPSAASRSSPERRPGRCSCDRCSERGSRRRWGRGSSRRAGAGAREGRGEAGGEYTSGSSSCCSSSSRGGRTRRRQSVRNKKRSVCTSMGVKVAFSCFSLVRHLVHGEQPSHRPGRAHTISQRMGRRLSGDANQGIISRGEQRSQRKRSLSGHKFSCFAPAKLFILFF